MAFNSVLPVFFISLTLLTTTATATATTAVATTATTATTLPLNITTINSAIISAGNFQNWATLLAKNPSLLPRNFTVFLPSTTSIKSSIVSPLSFNNNPFLYDGLTTVSYNQDFIFHEYHMNVMNQSSSVTKTVHELRSYFLLLYHIVPIRLSFSELSRFPASTRLPTLLPDYNLSIIKNSNSVSCSIAINGACITRPDLYQDESSFVHGVGSTFDYTKQKKEENETKSLPWMEIRVHRMHDIFQL